MNTDVIKDLITQLDDDDYKVRRTASKELRTIFDPEVKNALVNKIGDTDEIVRRNAVTGISNWDEKEMVDIIIPLLKDNSFDVRCGVIQALCKFNCETDRIIAELRDYLYPLWASGASYSKGQVSREYNLCKNYLSKIDQHLDQWLGDRHSNSNEQNYMKKIEVVKQRIDYSNILEIEAITSLSDVANEAPSRISAAKNLGKVYFDRNILPFIIKYPNSINYLPGKSQRGQFILQIDVDFDFWIDSAHGFNLRFNAEGVEDILNILLNSSLHDVDESVRYQCVHVLRALKDERSLPILKMLSNKYTQTTDDEGEEARDAIFEIEQAFETRFLPQFTSGAFEELALEIKNEVLDN